MRIFITGADGFIGRHLLEALVPAGHEILVSALAETPVSAGFKSVRWRFGDISSDGDIMENVRAFNPEAMVHLAWEGIPDYGYKMSKKNLDLTMSVADFVTRNSCCKKIIAAGSCWEYGRRKGACRESDLVAADSYFSWAKISACGYLDLRCRECNIDFKWMRLFYVYGPGQREKSLIPSIIRRLSEGRCPEIRNSDNRNDYVYVKDVAEALVRALEKNAPSGIYNVGFGKSVPAFEVASAVASAMGCGYHLEKSAEKGDCEDFWADTSRIREELEWIPKYSIEEGIAETVAQFKGRL